MWLGDGKCCLPSEPVEWRVCFAVMKTLVIVCVILFLLAFGKSRNRHALRSASFCRPWRSARGGTCPKPMSSKEKGVRFEDFVVDLLADRRLTLLERTQDRTSSKGVYAESCKNPDLHVRQQHGCGFVDYYLECKYKSRRNDDGTLEFDAYKIARYRTFQRERRRKVFLAVGIGSNPSAPGELLIVPIDALSGNVLPPDITVFRIAPSSESLISFIGSYFNTLFSRHSSS